MSFLDPLINAAKLAINVHKFQTTEKPTKTIAGLSAIGCGAGLASHFSKFPIHSIPGSQMLAVKGAIGVTTSFASAAMAAKAGDYRHAAVMALNGVASTGTVALAARVLPTVIPPLRTAVAAAGLASTVYQLLKPGPGGTAAPSH